MGRRHEAPRAGALHALSVCCLLCTCTAKVSTGSALLTANSTTFLAKFCFGHNRIATEHPGLLEVTLRAPDAKWSLAALLLLFDDEPQSYAGPSKQWDTLPCKEKVGQAKRVLRLDRQWWQLSRPEGRTFSFHIGTHAHPRFWYLVLADCSSEDLRVDWHAHFTNLEYGWAQELSAERRYSLFVLPVLAVIYACLAATQGHVNASLRQSAHSDSTRCKAAHPFARLLHAGILLALGEHVLLTMHSLWYAYDGYGAPLVAHTAELLAAASSFVLASLLLLISEGKCVSYIMVRGDVRNKLCILGPFLLSCFFLELWGESSVEQSYTNNYVYTTPAGWALILVDLLLLGAFAWKLRRTYIAERQQPEGAFYRTWGLLYGLWFLALPVAALLAQAVLVPYAWYMVCTIVKQGVTAVIYASLVVGLWPGNVKTYFKLWQVRDVVPSRPALPTLLTSQLADRAALGLSPKRFAHPALSP